MSKREEYQSKTPVEESEMSPEEQEEEYNEVFRKSSVPVPVTVNEAKCPICGGVYGGEDVDIIKYGVRRNKQVYKCLRCHRFFSVELPAQTKSDKEREIDELIQKYLGNEEKAEMITPDSIFKQDEDGQLW